MLQAGLMASLKRWNWMHQNHLHYEISFTQRWQNIIIEDSFPTPMSGSALSAHTSRTPPPSTSLQLVWMRNSNHTQEEVLTNVYKRKGKPPPSAGPPKSPTLGRNTAWSEFFFKMTCIHVMHNLHQTIWHQTFKMIWLNFINYLGSLCPFQT